MSANRSTDFTKLHNKYQKLKKFEKLVLRFYQVFTAELGRAVAVVKVTFQVNGKTQIFKDKRPSFLTTQKYSPNGFTC